MDNVIDINPYTTGSILPKKVIENTPNDLLKVLIIGVEQNGELYVASSHVEPEAALLIMRAQNYLMRLSGDQS